MSEPVIEMNCFKRVHGDAADFIMMIKSHYYYHQIEWQCTEPLKERMGKKKTSGVKK